MLYAILAYHVEDVVTSWSEEQDRALMEDLHKVHARLTKEGRLGPAARLDSTATACTLRRPGDGSASRDDAVTAARDLRRANPTAVYEIRPISPYLPGVAFPVTAA